MRTSRVQSLTGIKGFTFIELTIAILLTAILISFAAVNWGTFFGKDNQSLKDRLAVEVAMLREDAISRYEDRVIQFDMTNNAIESGSVDAVRGFEASRRIPVPPGLILLDTVINGQRVGSGISHMRIYALGFTDKAILHLADSRQGWTTIIIWPLTGEIESHNEYRDEIRLEERNNLT